MTGARGISAALGGAMERVATMAVLRRMHMSSPTIALALSLPLS
jgi:hypothetical protein